MRSIGCGLVCLLFIVLTACNSGQTSLEAQLKEDLHKVLENVSQDKNLSKKLGKTPPSSGLLNEDHIAMYIWVKSRGKGDASSASSTLFDTVAVYLAFDQSLAKIEELPIRVTDKGMTVIDQSARKMKVATAWKDMGAFEDLLVTTLVGE